MKKILMTFLQVIVACIGIGVLMLMLWEPHLEGRNVNATFFEIYFKDPFLAYVYTASIAFFAALYQAFMLLGFIGRNEVFAKHSVKALRTIKHCAMTLVAFLVGAEVYLFTVQRQVEEDIAGGVMMGLVLICIFVIVASVAASFEESMQRAANMKFNNDSKV